MKKRKGRAPCPAKLLEFNAVAYPLDAFPLPAKQGPGRSKAAAKQNTRQEGDPYIDFNNLPDVDIAALSVSDKIKEAIDTDGGELGGDDRSKGVAHVACELVRASCSDLQIASVLWFEPIGAHCRDQDDPKRAIRRAISYARREATKPDAASEFVENDQVIDELNKDHALVLVGGKSAILRETDEEPGGYTLISHSAFDHWCANRYITTRKGKRITISKYRMCIQSVGSMKGWCSRRTAAMCRDATTCGADTPSSPTQEIAQSSWRTSSTTSARAIAYCMTG